MIKTDHHSLKYFLNQRASTPFQHKWVSKLLGFDYEINYKVGQDNVVVDALSRAHGISTSEGSGALSLLECSSISYSYGGWLDEIWRYSEQDAWVVKRTKEVLDNLHSDTGSSSLAMFSFINGFLCYKGRIVSSSTSK